MPNYLKALHQLFTHQSPKAEKIQGERDHILAILRGQLSRSQRVLLRHLLDLEDDLRNEVSLCNFIAGIQLARGLYRELSKEPPYSFGNEREQAHKAQR